MWGVFNFPGILIEIFTLLIYMCACVCTEGFQNSDKKMMFHKDLLPYPSQEQYVVQ